MSTPTPSQAPDAMQPIRRQLDELEALLERMLALPVNALEDPIGPLVHLQPVLEESALEYRSGAAKVPTLPGLEPSSDLLVASEASQTLPEESNDDWIDLLAPTNSTPSPALQSRVPTDEVEDPTEGMVVSDPPGPSNGPAQTEKAFTAPTRRSLLNFQPSTVNWLRLVLGRSTKAAWCLAPLVWSNQGFDALAGRFGAPGRWLQGSGGRAWLGWTGVLLLVTALAWAILEWFGWTS